jgi:predicted transcriptional regulator
MSEQQAASPSGIDRAASIVAAYVSNNSVPTSELPTLISSVHTALLGLSNAASAATAAPIEKPTPAQIRKSISREVLISFEDGRPYKTLKRHLSGRGLTPEGYRAKYGLPVDYPMVAPSYSEQRSSLAKSLGLGRLGGAAARARSAKAQQPAPVAAEAPKRGRGGRRKAEPAQAAA